MGYIKYSWVRGKHTVQYPELTHVIHTEINYLPGPRAGLHSLRTRFCYTPSSCRRQESWGRNVCDQWNWKPTQRSADTRRRENTNLQRITEPLSRRWGTRCLGPKSSKHTNDQSEKHKHGFCVATWLLINEKRRRVSAHKVARWHQHSDEPFYSLACQLMSPSSPHVPTFESFISVASSTVV